MLAKVKIVPLVVNGGLNTAVLEVMPGVDKTVVE